MSERACCRSAISCPSSALDASGRCRTRVATWSTIFRSTVSMIRKSRERSRSAGLQLADRQGSKLDRVTVAGKTEVSAGAVLARVWLSAHVLVDFRQVGVQDDVAVQFDSDLAAL